jgi:hypothetical protein
VLLHPSFVRSEAGHPGPFQDAEILHLISSTRANITASTISLAAVAAGTCSQNLSTVHPKSRSNAVTSASRSTFRASFGIQ